MTLVYDPPLETGFGAEYCRANVEISLGTYDFNSEGKRVHKKEIPLEPSDISSMLKKNCLSMDLNGRRLKYIDVLFLEE